MRILPFLARRAGSAPPRCSITWTACSGCRSTAAFSTRWKAVVCFAARWALLCRRAPKLLQLGRGGPIALRGGTLGGLPLGLELVALARRPAAGSGLRL